MIYLMLLQLVEQPKLQNLIKMVLVVLVLFFSLLPIHLEERDLFSEVYGKPSGAVLKQLI